MHNEMLRDQDERLEILWRLEQEWARQSGSNMPSKPIPERVWGISDHLVSSGTVAVVTFYAASVPLTLLAFIFELIAWILARIFGFAAAKLPGKEEEKWYKRPLGVILIGVTTGVIVAFIKGCHPGPLR